MEQVLGRCEPTSAQIRHAVDRGATDRQLGQLGRGIPATPTASVSGRQLQRVGDTGIGSGAAQCQMSGPVRWISGRTSQPPVESLAILGRKRPVGNRSDEGMCEAQTAPLVDLHQAHPDDLSHGVCGAPRVAQRGRDAVHGWLSQRRTDHQ